jgi:hypothetical protein
MVNDMSRGYLHTYTSSPFERSASRPCGEHSQADGDPYVSKIAQASMGHLAARSLLLTFSPNRRSDAVFVVGSP